MLPEWSFRRDRLAWGNESDLLDIFESHGWDWSYHAFREWQGWGVEHGAEPQDLQPSTLPTDRQELLQTWFGRNQKPRW
jgi:hypothetical protein